ncbi:MAG: hypothetical protein KA419_08380 [Acidobacteria bacterium]|nr:hypothetical protein [Acidobacteriota bacterium]
METAPLSPEYLETLLTVCPVRVRPEGKAEALRLPPGACALTGAAPGARLILLPGHRSPFRFEAVTPGAFPVLQLEGPEGTVFLEFLSDRDFGPPGELSPAAMRAYYDALFRHVLRRAGSFAFRLQSAASSPDPRLRWGSRFCRLVFRRPGGYTAGMALYPFQGAEHSAAFLTAALAWFHHCRESRRGFDNHLVLCCHRDGAVQVPGRLGLLNPAMVRPHLWAYDPPLRALEEWGLAAGGATAPADFEFTPFRPSHDNPVVADLLRRHAPHLDLETQPRAFDQVTRLGLPIAQVFGPSEGDVRIGWRSPRVPYPDFPPRELDRWVRDVIRLRSFPAPERRHDVYRRCPERWMECAVLKDLRGLDPGFRPEWVYRQVPAWRGGGRSVLDVLTLDAGNRPAVLEIKADRDEACLFQALDYWDKVREGMEAGTFQACGYFEGVRLAGGPPRVFIVTPLFVTHPRLLRVAGYLSRDIPLFLLEGNLDWRGGWRTLRRSAPGAG